MFSKNRYAPKHKQRSMKAAQEKTFPSIYKTFSDILMQMDFLKFMAVQFSFFRFSIAKLSFRKELKRIIDTFKKSDLRKNGGVKLIYGRRCKRRERNINKFICIS